MFEDGTQLVNTYDGTGNRIAQEWTDGNGDPIKTVDYISELVYENDTLKTIHHAEGRIDMSDTSYQYYLRDHLGNVRTNFTTKSKVYTFEATMETETAAEEEQFFVNLPETRHTDQAADANNDGGDQIARINNTQFIGLSLIHI